MSQLGEVAAVSRKVIKYGSASLVAMMVLRVMWNVGYAWWKANHPDPPPPPDVKFGKLPMLEFPVVDLVGGWQYKLETPTGGLPNLPNQFKVYFMPIKKPNLLAYDEAAQLAENLGFLREPQKLSETEYRWRGNLGVSASLQMNIITGEFLFQRNWREDKSYLVPNFFIEKDKAVNNVKNYLARLGLLASDMAEGKSTVEFLKVQNGKLVQAASLSKSQFIRVNLFRMPIEGVAVVNPLVNKGLISAVLGLQREETKRFVEIRYSYFPVDLDQSASYPLIGVQAAWQKLQNGQAFVASVRKGVKQIVIRKIYLAYYDPDTPQQFMQPVYVFEGDDEFVAYVPAVADEWVSNSNQ